MHSTLDFCPRPSRKEKNICATALHDKKSKSLLSLHLYCDLDYYRVLAKKLVVTAVEKASNG
jgi:hypothetical protein